MGSLAEMPLPALLVGLHRDAFGGRLTLCRGTVAKHFDWRRGTPVSVQSRLPAERLCGILASQNALPGEARARVEQLVAARGCTELQALASLGLVPPRVVVLALAEQLRRAVCDCLDWREGEYRLEADAAGGSPPALPFDLLTVVADEVGRRWALHEILQALGPHALTHPTLVPGFAAPWLPDDARERLLGRLDGRTPSFALLHELADGASNAAFWVLDVLGALVHRAEPVPTPGPGAAEGDPEIEIVVGGSSAPGRDRARAVTSAPASVALDAAAETLRRELLSLHGRLASLSLWQVLGIERGAEPREVRRAYLRAAKRLHPDRIVQLGLAELKTQANELFAEIARAHDVLSDPQQRKLYEDSAEAPVTDGERIAEAEATFRRGEVLLRAGNFRGALELLERAVMLWPEEAEYQAALGWALHRKTPAERARAWEHFQRALALGEKAVWLLRASLVARELGHHAQATELGTRARALDPGVKA